MKVKILSFALIALLLSSFLILSVSAADTPTTFSNNNNEPFFETGNPDLSGVWSDSTFYINGLFKPSFGSDQITFLKSFFVDSSQLPIVLLSSDTTSSGLTTHLWLLEMRFNHDFYVDPVFNVNGTMISNSGRCNSILFYFHSYGSSSDAYLHAVYLNQDLTNILTLYFDPDSPYSMGHDFVYDPSHYLYFEKFGLSDLVLYDNFWSNTDSASARDKIYWMTKAFSSPVVADQISDIGFFKPVILSDGSSGPGGPGSVEPPTESFSRFAAVIFDFMESLLGIHFFGGFFSIGDLLGIVFMLSIVTLFVKWFAGG